MELPYDPAIPLLRINPKNPKAPVQKNVCNCVFTAMLDPIATCWKQFLLFSPKTVTDPVMSFEKHQLLLILYS